MLDFSLENVDGYLRYYFEKVLSTFDACIWNDRERERDTHSSFIENYLW